MEKMKLVSPWINFYNEICALFERDPEVNVKYDDENNEIKIYVDDPRKAEAIQYIMPFEKVFGNVTVKIAVIPANKPIDSIDEALNIAFKYNYCFNMTQSVDTPFGKFNYAIFSPTTVQYHNDDIGDIDGKRTATVEEIAKEVLNLGDSWHICSNIIHSNWR